MYHLQKKLIIFLLLSCGMYVPAAGCDICGGGAGGNYTGILPQFQKNIAGVRFQYRNFLHPATSENMNGNSRVQEDRFFTQELWMRLYPAPRIQVFVFVPYRVHQRQETQRTTTIQGMGDMYFTANYTLVNTGDSVKKKWKNVLLVGGGIKLPTGRYQQRDETRVMLPASFQTGSGAYAYLFNVLHTLRVRKWGLYSNVQYSIPAVNELQLRNGRQLSASATVFYWKKIKKSALLPNIGVSYENAQKDLEYGVVKAATGGSVTFANAGLDIYLQRLLINTFVQLPLFQQVAYAQPENQLRAGVGISYFFNTDNSRRKPAM